MARGDGYLFKRPGDDEWWGCFYYGGRRCRQNLFTTDEAVARRALAARVVNRAYATAISRLRRRGPELRLTGAELLALRQPLVYVWYREGKPLYVGKGEAGLARPLHPNHHRLRWIGPSDELRLHPCDTATEAVTLEARLIQKLRPPYNRALADLPQHRRATRQIAAGSSLPS